jgi:hypothetical protein
MTKWLLRIWLWLKEPRLLWFSLLVLFLSMLCALLPAPTEPRLRIVGLFLQLSGIGSVVWGLSETRKLFGRPSVFDLARQWVRRFPPFRLKPITGTVQAIMGTASIIARATLWANAGPAASVEQRLDVLERNLLSVNERANELQNQLDSDIRTRDRLLVDERAAREQADQDIRQKLQLTETGGLHLSLAGIIWLCSGLVLSTVPNEIIWLFSR